MRQPANCADIALNWIGLDQWTPEFVATATKPNADWAAMREAAVASLCVDNLPKAIQLPALPQAVTEFVQKAANPGFDLKVLAAIVEKDSALTMELLKHVNSVAFKLRTPVRCVKDAILYLGINTAKSHLLAVGMRGATRAIRSRLINPRNFWNESLQRGLFACEIARCMKFDTSLAFLGGLLQDYLLPVLTNHFDQEYVEFLNEHARYGRDLADWERERFGWDHASAGAWYASQWHFPDDLLCALFYHHAPSFTLQDGSSELLQVFPVALAGMLPDQMSQVSNGFRELIGFDAACSSFSLEEVCRLVDESHTKLAEGVENPNHLSQMLQAARRQLESADQ